MNCSTNPGTGGINSKISVTADQRWLPFKREKTLIERGLDFACVGEIFKGVATTIEDTRQNYGETRFMTIGKLGNRVVVLIWTPRGEVCRIISMRFANEREITKYAP